ncbi:MAG: hypothetical protein RJB60_2919 [Pseudomonadota bacterium]
MQNLALVEGGPENATEITENIVQFDPVTRDIISTHPIENIIVEDEKGRVVQRRQELYVGSDHNTVSQSTLTYNADGDVETETRDGRGVFNRTATTTSTSGGLTYKTGKRGQAATA